MRKRSLVKIPNVSLLATLVLSAGCWLVAAPDALADDTDEVREPQRCINSRSIRRTEVINDDYVLFWVQGRRMYLNALQSSCTGLTQERRFSFETTTRSLCAHDKIRVLRESGLGVYEGRSCTLGRFQEMTEEALDDFIKERTRTPQPEDVEPAEVEDVVKEES